MAKVIGGADVRLTIIDNDPNVKGFIVHDSHIVKDFSASKTAPQTPISALGTTKTVDRVPGPEANTYKITLCMSYDEDNPVLSFGENIAKLNQAVGKTDLTIMLRVHKRGFADKPNRDDNLLDVLYYDKATISASDSNLTSDAVDGTMVISGEFRGITYKSNDQYNDASGV